MWGLPIISGVSYDDALLNKLNPKEQWRICPKLLPDLVARENLPQREDH